MIAVPILIGLHDPMTSVYVIVNGIFNATKTKPAVKDSSAVFFVALPESRILVKLSENFV